MNSIDQQVLEHEAYSSALSRMDFWESLTDEQSKDLIFRLEDLFPIKHCMADPYFVRERIIQATGSEHNAELCARSVMCDTECKRCESFREDFG